MTLTSSARRQDQPVQIGGQHGYRIEGERAFINAELSVPPYHPGGEWALELWASEYAYDGGELSGVKISEVAIELPTPIAPHTHRVDVEVPAQLPIQGRVFAMSLALVELNGGRRVHDVASYPELETFPAPYFQGDVGYLLQGHEVLLQADGVFNPRAWGNLSGTLALELWASDGGERHCVAAAQLTPLAGREGAQWLQCRALFSEPPVGQWQLQLALREWTHAYGYVTRDERDFAVPYLVEGRSVEAEAPVAVAAPATRTAAPAATSSAAVPAAEAPKAAAAAVAAPKAAAPVAADAPKAAAPTVVASAAVAAPKAAVTPVAAAAPTAVAAAPVVAAPVVTPASKPAAPVAAAPAAAAPVAAAPAAAAPVAVAPVATPASKPAAPVVAAAPIAAAAPVVAAAPVAAAPVAAAAAAPAASAPARTSRQISIMTASVEELARIKGLNLRVAKEIIKARPYAVLEDVLKVEGVGRKTFDRIRSLITL